MVELVPALGQARLGRGVGRNRKILANLNAQIESVAQIACSNRARCQILSADEDLSVFPFVLGTLWARQT